VALRVLMLAWEYPPLIEGGLARHVGRLADALADQGVMVQVLTRAPSGVVAGWDIPPARFTSGVRVERVEFEGCPRELDEFMRWVPRLNERLLQAAERLAVPDRFDLVHGHDWLVGPASSALAERLGVPLVVTVHATEHGRHRGRVGQPPQSDIHAAECALARRADAVICCSEFMRGHVAAALGLRAGDLQVIPNGSGLPARRPPGAAAAMRSRYAREEQQLVLLAGRLVYEKGFQVALEAMGTLAGGHPGLRFVVAGAGPYESELSQQAARLGLGERGRFAGWVDDEDLADLYAASDLCVVPSLYEPFGLVALEAMAAACPCLVSATGGLRELVPPGAPGMCFAPGDAPALARKLELALANPGARRTMAAAAREHAASLSWDDVGAHTAALYRGLTGVPEDRVGAPVLPDGRRSPAVGPSLRSSGAGH